MANRYEGQLVFTVGNNPAQENLSFVEGQAGLNYIGNCKIRQNAFKLAEHIATNLIQHEDEMGEVEDIPNEYDEDCQNIG